MKFGAAWYPEHWPEERWPVDLKYMREARMNVVRIAEFAWSRLEPSEGKFEFEWLDRAINLAASQGIVTVLGTPTAAPPAWLTQKYPDTLSLDANGQRAVHGNRCHYNPWSKTYRVFCRRITEQMVRRYGKHPSVIGWQFDNEYNHMSYDGESRQAFQDFLKAKFKTLDALNEAWSGAYWSEDYSDWTQIPLPVGHHNPGLRLEFQRFHSWTYRQFQKNQLDLVRKHAEARQWTTHNFMGWYGLYDHYELNADLDLASWDSYWPAGTPDPSQEAAIHDLTRGFKQKNFWLMETQPNTVNWAEVNTMLEPGRLRLRNLQAVAHGADAILYWQWRNALGGQEQLHGAVIGTDGKPRPVWEEIKQLGRELEAAGKVLDGGSVPAQAALINSYDSRWALSFQPMHKDYDYVKHFQDHYDSFFRTGTGVDVLSVQADLSAYPLVVLPALWVLTQENAAKFERYVNAGGHLVISSRCGAKDGDNALHPLLAPGPLAALAGVEVEDTYPLVAPLPVVGSVKGNAKIWSERLRVNAKGVEVWAKFGKGCGWVEGLPAVVSRKVGQGRVTTLAGWFEPALLSQVMAKARALAKLKDKKLPAGLELVERKGPGGKRSLFVLNHADKPAKLTLPKGKDVFSGKKRGGPSTVPAREVFLLDLE
jgi:beta-galactosidase